jgi:hypothetical protein
LAGTIHKIVWKVLVLQGKWHRRMAFLIPIMARIWSDVT